MEGANIERGRIVEIIEASYTVLSLTRDGITTPPIPAIGTQTYEAGDLVYFFLFCDGRGAIIAAFE